MFCGVRNTKLIVGGGAIVLIVAATIIAVFVLTNQNSERTTALNWGNKFTSNSELGVYTKGAVSANGPECSSIGMSMLVKGGSAVDGAIAALLCEGIASLHSMGLGGGFFMTIWDPANGGKADYLDARETAPSAANKDMFHGNATLAMLGGKAVAVPGELLGYWEAHKKYGKLRWRELFEPAIELCAKGAIVNDYLAVSLAKQVSRIRSEPTMAEILIDPKTNFTWTVGDRIKRPRLAETLRILSLQNDTEIFYGGSMGEQLIKEIEHFGGIMKIDDLRNYAVKWKKPVEAKLGRFTMYTAPPPGSGLILGFIMNVLRDFVPTTDERAFWQRIVETFKWAYARRTELADPDYEDIGSVVDELSSESYAKKVQQSVKDDWTSRDPKFYGASVLPIEHAGTANVVVLAPDGSAVSVTSTINQVLGAMIRSKTTGIIFNDEMDDFSSPNITNSFDLPPSPANFIKPGKRPLSSMTPTIVVDENKKVRLVIGAAGGTKITTAIATTMILTLWSGYSVKEAVDARRIHHQLLPMEMSCEPRFNETILSYLHGIGHKSTFYQGIGSAVTAIAQENGRITANSDYRRQGTVAGF